MKLIKQYILLLRLAKTVLWWRYWMIRTHNPTKRKLCTLMFTVGSEAYNALKPKWWPKISAPYENIV